MPQLGRAPWPSDWSRLMPARAAPPAPRLDRPLPSPAWRLVPGRRCTPASRCSCARGIIPQWAAVDMPEATSRACVGVMLLAPCGNRSLRQVHLAQSYGRVSTLLSVVLESWSAWPGSAGGGDWRWVHAGEPRGCRLAALQCAGGMPCKSARACASAPRLLLQRVGLAWVLVRPLSDSRAETARAETRRCEPPAKLGRSPDAVFAHTSASPSGEGTGWLPVVVIIVTVVF